jgi:ABC-type glycerol-3-phosphate transport system permease component
MTQTATVPSDLALDVARVRMQIRVRQLWVLSIVYLVLLVAITVILFPVFWMFSSSFKGSTELFAFNMTLLPVDWTLENYRNVWQNTPFPNYFWNSFKVAAISTVLSVVISMYAAYALARIQFRGRNAFGMLMLVTQMFPHIMLVIPLFLIIQRIGLFNTHTALVLAYTAFSLPFTIWLLRGFFEAIPFELEEALGHGPPAVQGPEELVLGCLHVGEEGLAEG